jgi:hypothetical protein
MQREASFVGQHRPAKAATAIADARASRRKWVKDQKIRPTESEADFL